MGLEKIVGCVSVGSAAISAGLSYNSFSNEYRVWGTAYAIFAAGTAVLAGFFYYKGRGALNNKEVGMLGIPNETMRNLEEENRKRHAENEAIKAHERKAIEKKYSSRCRGLEA